MPRAKRHALTGVAAGLGTAVLVLPIGAQAAPANVFTAASASGVRAIVALAYVDTHPAAGISLGVAASPNRRVLVSWALSCTTRTGTTQTSGRWKARTVVAGFGPAIPTTFFTPLHVPHAVVCVVSMSVLALNGSGPLTAAIAQ